MTTFALRYALILPCATLLWAGAALAQSTGTPAASTMSAMPGMASIESPADKSMAAGMTQMSQAMNAVPMTGNADHDFVTMMIPHHQGAVTYGRG